MGRVLLDGLWLVLVLVVTGAGMWLSSSHAQPAPAVPHGLGPHRAADPGREPAHRRRPARALAHGLVHRSGHTWRLVPPGPGGPGGARGARGPLPHRGRARVAVPRRPC